MLRQQRFRVSFVLLRPVDRLGIGIQLRVQCAQCFPVVIFVARQLTRVLPLELCQLRILLIQISLGFLELPADEGGRVLSYCLARVLKFRQDGRRQVVAHILRVPRIGGRKGYIEARHGTALPWFPPAAGVSNRAEIRDHRLDLYACAHVFQNIVKALAAVEQSLPLLHDRLQAVSPQDLLLHGRNPLRQVRGDHRLHYPLGNLLPLHQHQRLRGVFRSKGVGDQEADQRRQQRRNQNQFQAPAEHRQVVVQRQIAIFNHCRVSILATFPGSLELIDPDRPEVPVHADGRHMSYRDSVAERPHHRASIKNLVVPLIPQEGSPVVAKLPAHGEACERIVVGGRSNAQCGRLQPLIVSKAHIPGRVVLPSQDP